MLILTAAAEELTKAFDLPSVGILVKIESLHDSYALTVEPPKVVGGKG